MSEIPHQFTADDSTFIDGIERILMGSSRRYRRRELSEHAGVDPEETRRVWRALGFVNSREGDVAFSDTDLRALRAAMSVTATHDLDVDTLLGLARALGRTTDRLAMWQTQLVADMISQRQDAPPEGKELAKATARTMADLADDLARRLHPDLAPSARAALLAAAEDRHAFVARETRKVLRKFGRPKAA